MNIFEIIGQRMGIAMAQRKDHEVHNLFGDEYPETCRYCEDDVNGRWAMLGYWT